MQPETAKILHILPSAGGVALLLTLILAAGCTGQAPEPGLKGTEWSLTGYVLNGPAQSALAGSEVTLLFGNDGKVSGSAGCNRYFASFEAAGGTITFGQAGSTMMYCGEPGVMEQESAYLALLSQATTFAREGDSLILSDAKGTKILSYTKKTPPAPEPLAGTPWTLESVHSRDAVSSVIAGTAITAGFGADGRVTGSAGCNNYFASWETKGTAMTISQPGSTKMHCGQPGVMEQESTYLRNLNTTRSYSIKGSQLALFDDQGRQILTFRKTT